MSTQPLPELGIGMMYLPGLESAVEAGADTFDVIEIEPQTLSHWRDGQLRLQSSQVAFLQSLPAAKLVHGVGAPVAGPWVDERMLGPFLEACSALNPPWASEHLTFNRYRSRRQLRFTGFMLPMIQTVEAVDLAVSNIRALEERIARPFAFETPVNYLRPSEHELSDGQFMSRIATEADCGILLDIHNLWCNEQNGRQPVMGVLDELDLSRVWEVHLAAGRRIGDYWVDSHSGLIQEPVWGMAERVLPRLPNVKAIIFETMPEYLWQQGITPQQIEEEMSRLRHVWELRATASFVEEPPPSPDLTESAVLDPAGFADRLGSLVAGGDPADPSDALAEDPGVQIYRMLLRSVRGGVITDSLRLTYRMLILSLGADAADELLGRYFTEMPAQQVAIDEIRQFAAWTDRAAPIVDHLPQVAAFEVASFEVSETNAAQEVEFDCEPLQLLGALGEGRLPPALVEGDYVLEITPDLAESTPAV